MLGVGDLQADGNRHRASRTRTTQRVHCQVPLWLPAGQEEAVRDLFCEDIVVTVFFKMAFKVFVLLAACLFAVMRRDQAGSVYRCGPCWCQISSFRLACQGAGRQSFLFEKTFIYFSHLFDPDCPSSTWFRFLEKPAQSSSGEQAERIVVRVSRLFLAELTHAWPYFCHCSDLFTQSLTNVFDLFFFLHRAD